MKLKVAIDSSSLSSEHAVRGIGTMVGEQIRWLKQKTLMDKGSNVKIDSFDFESDLGRKKLKLGGYDILHYPYFFPYTLTLPTQKYAKKIVITIQDLIHLVYPRNYPPGLRGTINFWKQKFRLKKIDAVITISETSKKDIVRFLNVPPEKIHVIFLAPKKIFKKLANGNWKDDVRKRYNLPERFVLYVGDVNYNKNIPNLIEACKLAKVPLVICGKHALEVEELGSGLKILRGPRDWLRFIFNIPHPELVHYKYLSREFESNRNIIRCGFVPDSDLVTIYNLASVYVQPSFYEGFGLPVFEAMASGLPVVVSKTNALVEISGGASLIVDPNKPEEIAQAIKKVIQDKSLRKDLIKRGFERVKAFSWERTAKKMLEVYKKVALSE